MSRVRVIIRVTEEILGGFCGTTVYQSGWKDFNILTTTMAIHRGVPGGASGKEPACQCRRQMRVQSLGQADPLEEGMAMHSSVLSWRTLWTEKLGELWSIALQRVRHGWSNLAHMYGYPIVYWLEVGPEQDHHLPCYGHCTSHYCILTTLITATYCTEDWDWSS